MKTRSNFKATFLKPSPLKSKNKEIRDLRPETELKSFKDLEHVEHVKISEYDNGDNLFSLKYFDTKNNQNIILTFANSDEEGHMYPYSLVFIDSKNENKSFEMDLNSRLMISSDYQDFINEDNLEVISDFCADVKDKNISNMLLKIMSGSYRGVDNKDNKDLLFAETYDGIIFD